MDGAQILSALPPVFIPTQAFSELSQLIAGKMVHTLCSLRDHSSRGRVAIVLSPGKKARSGAKEGNPAQQQPPPPWFTKAFWLIFQQHPSLALIF